MTNALPYPAYEVQQSLKPKTLEGLSEKLIDQHWKLYEGYVTNTNFLNKGIWEALEAGTEINKPSVAEMQRRLGFEYNGMVLHEYYFGALRPGTKNPAASTSLGKKLASAFGSFERWKKQFSEIGKMRGIGWVVLYEDWNGQLFNQWINEHETGHLAGCTPVLVMDVFEHAYMIDYQLKRADYITAFFKNINWENVEKRIK